jgi:hypothetical protein
MRAEHSDSQYIGSRSPYPAPSDEFLDPLHVFQYSFCKAFYIRLRRSAPARLWPANETRDGLIVTARTHMSDNKQ